MLRSSTLKSLYEIFLTEEGNPFAQHSMLDAIKKDQKIYTAEILKFLETTIVEENVNKLRFCLVIASIDGLDKVYAKSFEKLLFATWHDEHKDLIDVVCRLKDEYFVEALVHIIENKLPYRKYDGTDEALLKKCVKVLKAIDSQKANAAINKLLANGNPSIAIALEQFDQSQDDPCK